MVQLVERRVLAPQPRRQLPKRQVAVAVPVQLPPEIVAGLQPLVLRQVRHAQIDHLARDDNIGSANHSTIAKRQGLSHQKSATMPPFRLACLILTTRRPKQAMTQQKGFKQ